MSLRESPQRYMQLIYLVTLLLVGLSRLALPQCIESPPSGPRSYSSSTSISAGNAPRGVALDARRQVVYSVNTGNDQLRGTRLDGTLIWSRSISNPWGVAVDESTGHIYVSQYAPRVVTVFNSGGTVIGDIGATSTNNYGEPGFFNGPAGLAVVDDRLVVTDPENNRFQVFSTAGELEGVGGRKGFGDGAFGGTRPGPYGVAAHVATNQLYFVDPALHRVSRWEIVDGTPVFQTHFGDEGRQPGGLWWPFALSVQQNGGDVYVASTNTFRIEVFSGCGDHQGTMGSLDGRSIAQCNASPIGETIFRPGVTAPVATSNRYSFDPITVGVQFTVRAAGFVTAVRFVRPSGDAAQHTVRVWDIVSRSLLYSQAVQMDHCRAGAWVTMGLRTAVAVATGRRYAVTLDEMDQYAASPTGFSSTSLAGGSVVITPTSAGIRTTDATTAPSTADGTNYWVDIEFQSNAAFVAPTTSGLLTGYAYGVAVSNPDATGTSTVYVADASSTSLRTYRLSTPSSPSPTTTSLPRPTPTPAGVRPASLCNTFPTDDGTQTFYREEQVPTLADLTDGETLVLGQRMSFLSDGVITAIRFFKSEGEGGTTHVGKVYETAITRLLSTTRASDDSACDGPAWVSIPLAAPLAVSAGVEYTIAIDYVRYYVKNPQYLRQALTQGPIRLSQSGGVYSVVTEQMPRENGAESSNYWIDVEFRA